MSSRRHSRKVAKKAAKKKRVAKKTKAATKSVKKKTGRKRARGTARKSRPRGGSNSTRRKATSASALRKLQPELESAVSRLLGRLHRKLSRLPQSEQLKLIEVETGGFTYTLNRLRPPPEDGLTQRQKEIARLVSQGLSNKEIAGKLRISPATVAAHLRTIFTKLRVKTRTALAKHALAYYG